MITKLHESHFNVESKKKDPPRYLRKTFVKEDNLATDLVKFSKEDKIRIVIEGQSSQISIAELCSREGITLRTFNNWTNDYLLNQKNEENSQGSDTLLSDDYEETYEYELSHCFTIINLLQKEIEENWRENGINGMEYIPLHGKMFIFNF